MTIDDIRALLDAWARNLVSGARSMPAPLAAARDAERDPVYKSKPPAGVEISRASALVMHAIEQLTTVAGQEMAAVRLWYLMQARYRERCTQRAEDLRCVQLQIAVLGPAPVIPPPADCRPLRGETERVTESRIRARENLRVERARELAGWNHARVDLDRQASALSHPLPAPTIADAAAELGISVQQMRRLRLVGEQNLLAWMLAIQYQSFTDIAAA